MRDANGRNPPTNRQATAKQGSPTHSTEQRETVRRGLRILAQMIVRTHPLWSGAAPEPSAEGEDAD